MNGRAENVTVASASADRPGTLGKCRELPPPQWWRVGGYAAYLGVLALLFIQPLTRLLMYAVHNDLNSHILLVPFISAWLIYVQRGPRLAAYCSSMPATLIACAIGIAITVGCIRWCEIFNVNDELALVALAFVIFVAAGGFLFLGAKWMAAHAFPIAFLIFMLPLPSRAVSWLETVSMLRSADAANLFFRGAGVPFVRHGTVFELPRIVIRVATECSGIHSSWVLFITSLLASHLFLKTWWRRLVLVAFVIPLGIVRNGFRILIIGWLCVHIGPNMIDSSIHHRGGPLFFALSLIPLFLLLLWLRRREQGSRRWSGEA